MKKLGNIFIHHTCQAFTLCYLLKTFSLFLIILFISCTNTDTKEKTITKRSDLENGSVGTGYPVTEVFIDKGEEEGWGADIRLSITYIIKSDSFTIYKVNSLYKKKNIGLEFIIPNKPEKENALAQTLTIKTSGQ